jgi:hypothetical protein
MLLKIQALWDATLCQLQGKAVDCLTMEMKTLCSIKTSVPVYQGNMPEDLMLQGCLKSVGRRSKKCVSSKYFDVEKGELS